MGMGYYRAVKSFLLSPSAFYQRNKFIKYMNRFARSIGMIDSYFNTPSGASSISFSTPFDLYHLLRVFTRNDTLRSYCEAKEYCVRERKILNTALQDSLKYFGAPLAVKTGTWGNENKALCLFKTDFSLCVMTNNSAYSSNIHNVALQIYNTSFIGESVSYYGSLRGRIIKHNEHTKYVPASTTKLLTALCAYKICGLRGSVTVERSDIAGGSGSVYATGESLLMSDAVKIMLMESSNTLANAIARECGKTL